MSISHRILKYNIMPGVIQYAQSKNCDTNKDKKSSSITQRIMR